MPQEVATEIISTLLDAAQAHFDGKRPTRAVVSVPAYFTKEARAATEEAARAAGLQTVRLVREPVAAALGYGLRPGAPRDETVLVVDLGGGALSFLFFFWGVPRENGKNSKTTHFIPSPPFFTTQQEHSTSPCSRSAAAPSRSSRREETRRWGETTGIPLWRI